MYLPVFLKSLLRPSKDPFSSTRFAYAHHWRQGSNNEPATEDHATSSTPQPPCDDQLVSEKDHDDYVRVTSTGQLSPGFAHLAYVIHRLVARLCTGWPLQLIGGLFLCQVIAVKLCCSFDVDIPQVFSLALIVEVPVCRAHGVTVIGKQTIARVEALERTTSQLALWHGVSDSLPAASDQLPRRDFALHGGGSDVLPHLTSPTAPFLRRSLTSKLWAHLRGYDVNQWLSNPPHTALENDIRVGNCWAIDGSRGHLGILLSEAARIRRITVNHVAPWLVSAVDSQQTPRTMVLWGRVKDAASVASSDTCTSECFAPSAVAPHRLEHFVRLADFYYNNSSPRRLQTFEIAREVATTTFDVVVLQIHDNWGANTTCLYHFGVYGEAAY